MIEEGAGFAAPRGTGVSLPRGGPNRYNLTMGTRSAGLVALVVVVGSMVVAAPGSAAAVAPCAASAAAASFGGQGARSRWSVPSRSPTTAGPPAGSAAVR